MKISLLIAAIIVSLAALFGTSQRTKIKNLTTEWEDLKIKAQEQNIPTDPTVAFSSQRVRSESTRAAREKAISDFASELAAFAQKMEDNRGNGMREDPGMQKEVIGFLDKLTSLNGPDLKSLFKILAADTSIKEDTKKELMMMSVMMLSSDNPEAALAIISESSEALSLDSHMLPMIIDQYSAKDPDGAALWIVENEELLGDNSKEMKMRIIALAAKESIQSALAMTKTLEIEEEYGVYQSLASSVTSGTQDEFLEALESTNLEAEQRKHVLANLMNSPFMKEDFEKATAWLDGPDFAPADRESIMKDIHYHSVREAPEKWLGWVSGQEEKNEATKRATRQILEGWTRNNFVAAGEWVQNQEAGPAKNEAVQTYAGTLAPHEPAAAADWAATLPEGQERTNLFHRIHGAMNEKDPAAAAALAEKHGLKLQSTE